MRSFILSLSAFIATLALASATEDPCAQMCSYVEGCANSKYDSYCKTWQSPSVCFGLIKKSDGSICFEPTDADCVGESIACGEQQPSAAPGTTVMEGTTGVPMTTTASVESSGASTSSARQTSTVVETTQSE
ncbi:hypothetical protein Pmar_PMAR023430 [Perkinsus marinus ATCC 50983]|uniref:Merozoite surface protein 2 n=1 Tax=Perkinsus marinus (strain ATCC 50983 / TXsc) TaxID=423536 RepID=C5KKJ2_PERM5|nr:hypothetical protein Pmar_PMAR023430 [Perkinsus marinus ATCC 50983]EER15104.1 hypothetical protein Pmar_PMAR023430 [Perkinsus marinus ATCC 50983]|eukprot:XP_002783308.1 hypothetical protein Pmar_PMAR023430 [Perkinsus marinus ATCC 50983]